MFFWRTHWAWSCDWEEWNPNHYSNWDGKHGGWIWHSTHYGDYDAAFDKYGDLRKLPPGQVRNLAINRRAVGAPMNWLKSS